MKNQDILEVAKLGDIESFSDGTFKVSMKGLMFQFCRNFTGKWVVSPCFESGVIEYGETPADAYFKVLCEMSSNIQKNLIKIENLKSDFRSIHVSDI